MAADRGTLSALLVAAVCIVADGVRGDEYTIDVPCNSGYRGAAA
jgi:hypothetical protein